MHRQSSIPFNQSGIGVRAITMTAKTAPANAAAPITAAVFLLRFFFIALQISMAPTTQTAASAMTSVSHCVIIFLFHHTMIATSMFTHLMDDFSTIQSVVYKIASATFFNAARYSFIAAVCFTTSSSVKPIFLAKSLINPFSDSSNTPSEYTRPSVSNNIIFLIG